MTEYYWIPTREHAIETWGETPGAELEHEIISQFTQEPTRVLRAIEHVTRRHADGKITSCWAVLRAELQARPAVDVAASDKGDKTKATRRAEQWIKTAGVHFESESEVDDELFGDRSQLRDWHEDHALRLRMVEMWRELRRAADTPDVEPQPDLTAEERKQQADEIRARFRDLLSKSNTPTEQAATPEPSLASSSDSWDELT